MPLSFAGPHPMPATTPPASPDAAAAADPRALMGMARLTRLAFGGADLVPLGQRLIQRAAADPLDANALLDLSTVLQLQGLRDLGLATQHQALKLGRIYTLAAARPPAVQLLAIMTPGDLMANMPLPLLFEDSDIALTLLYLVPGEPLPASLPPHDVAIIAIAESDRTQPLLQQLADAVAGWPKPVLNLPQHIARTARDSAYRLLDGITGICMPSTARLTHAQLLELGRGALLQAQDFPLILRPVDSHAGQGLVRLDDNAALLADLATRPEGDYFLARFIDYRSADGLYRKFRIALVDGQPFAGHMAVSAHWMIHYLNAGMTDSAVKRTDEQAFMAGFESGFAARHRRALAALAERVALPYVVIDCAETPAGDLLVFEVDPACVVHAMDPEDLFGYKHAPMQRVFAAFRDLLLRSVRGG